MDENAPMEPERWREEQALRQADLRLREREVNLKERQSGWLHNPVFVGLIAAALGLSSNAFVSFLQNRSAEGLARDKFRYDVVLEATRTDDPQKAAKRLDFLLRIHYLDDPDGAIRSFVANPENIPLSPPTGFGVGGFGNGGFGGGSGVPDNDVACKVFGQCGTESPGQKNHGDKPPR